ncbi:hypothetical protein SUGI_0128700 [Cryptomeria japonica]|nr:hypothetical protein SUGI_0128700 [Cryptomeria japonica]
MVGISFKIAKTGIKYSPPSVKKRPYPSRCTSSLDNAEKPPEVNQHKRRRAEVTLPKINVDHNTHSLLSTTSKGSPTTSEHEASFAVNLFLDGFSVGKPTEQGKQAPSAQELIRSLHPYNRTSETLFQAINDGWLPGDILEEIPCKYVNGSVVCEVRDYRKGSPTSGDLVSSGEGFPVVHKVLLRPTMENIVKDISSMAESWAYSDLMEIESRILKAVQPKLCLDPAPMLERLCENSNSNKLNLELPLSRRERKQRGGFPLVKEMSNNLSHGKKVSIEGNIERAIVQTRIAGAASGFEDSGISCSQENSAPTTADISSSIATRSRTQSHIESRQELSRLGVQGPSNSLSMQSGLNRPRILPGPVNLSPPVTSVSLASPPIQDWTNSVDARHMYTHMPGKRERDLAPANKPDLKKPKQEQICMDKFQQQNVGPNFDTKPTRDQQRKDMVMQQNQNNESMYISDMSVHRLSQQVTTDDDQLATGSEMSAQDPKPSSYIDPRSTAVFKVKEEHLEFERGQIGIERESQEFARSKETQHLMELDNDQSCSTQISSQRFPQQPYSKSSFQWQSLGQAGEKDQKRDELMKKKLVQSPRVLQSQPLTKLGDLSQPLISTTVTNVSLGPCNNMAASVGQQKEKSVGLSTVLTTATSVSSIQIDSQHQQAQQSMSFGRRKSNSHSKQPSASGVASPGSVTNSMAPSNVNSPSTGTAPLPNSLTKPDQSSLIQDQSKQLETISTLVSTIQRHGLPIKKKSVEEVRETKKGPPSWHLLSMAFSNATNNEDQKDVKGQRSLSNSLVGGGVNVRKTRIMNFVRADHMYPGNSVPVLVRRIRVRLVMCERAKDGMVEAVVQFGDDQDEDSLNCCPHDVLPSLPNTHFADRLAVQFSTLMEKDGYELVDDQVQPIQQRQQMLPPNASSTTQSMTPVASALGNSMNQLPSSPHVMSSQNMVGSAAVCGMPPLSSLPLSSPNALAVRMPPPGNAPNRQLSSGFLQSGLVTSKSLQLDPASELVAVQQQQHQQHQIQQQHQLQQHPQQQLQRSQQLMKMQMLQKHHQQLQRKSFLQGGMGSNIGNIGVGNISVNNMSGHNMVGLGGGMSMGMTGINNISGVMPNLTNINTLSGVGSMGQNPGIGSMIEHHIRSGTMNNQTPWDRGVRMGPGRGRPGAMVNPPSLRNIENMSGLSASNQAHSSANLIHGPQQGRSNMSSLQNRGMNPPKTSGMHGVTGQSFYLNQQLNNQPQQISSQQLNQQQQLNVQQQLNMPQPPSSQQPLSSQPLLNAQHQMSQQISSQQQINSQSQLNSQQQLNAQQLNSQPQLNPQQINAANLGSMVVGPSSPPLSSQTLGSVGSITSSPMELQSASRGNSMTTGQ